MEAFIDLRHLTRLIQMMGVPARLGNDGVETIYVGEVDDTDGTPRYTVVAGPGRPTPTGHGWIPLGTFGEFGFHQDADDATPAYPVRRGEAPIDIAAGIVRLHHAVQARRVERARLTAELAVLPAIVEPEQDSGAGGTTVSVVDWDAVLTGEVSAINLICDRDHHATLFRKILHITVSEALTQGPIEEAVVYATSGCPPIRYDGRIMAVTDDGRLLFDDGLSVSLHRVLAVKF